MPAAARVASPWMQPTSMPASHRRRRARTSRVTFCNPAGLRIGVACGGMKPLCATLALALAACAHPPAMTDHSPSLAAAETAFAAHSVREDMRVAFLAAFADDGVFVREGWRVSNDFLRDRAAPPIVLDWRPQYVEAASSGDLGLSTGPSKIMSKTDPRTPPTFGQFVSVWRRAPGGAWKVAVDLGIAHPEDTLWKDP